MGEVLEDALLTEDAEHIAAAISLASNCGASSVLLTAAQRRLQELEANDVLCFGIREGEDSLNALISDTMPSVARPTSVSLPLPADSCTQVPVANADLALAVTEDAPAVDVNVGHV